MSRSGFGMRGQRNVPRGVVLLSDNKDGSNSNPNVFTVSSMSTSRVVNMNPYAQYASTLYTPPVQTEPENERQVENSAGGYVYEVSDMDRFKRFLVLGSEGGTFYITEKQLTKENCTLIIKLIKEGNGVELVKVIKEYSLDGRCPKQGPLIFALSACCRLGDVETKREAYDIVSDVCRIPTHLFMLITYCELLSENGTGWGRAHRRAIKNWYNTKRPRNLAYLVTKYQNREGWSHRDVLRLAHVKAQDKIHNVVYHYIVKDREILNDEELMEEEELDTLDFLKVVEEVKKESISEDAIVDYIIKYKLAREHIPNRWFSNARIWQTLLIEMPITAMIRNLGKMTNTGIFSSDLNVKYVTKRLTSEEILRKGRVHPLVVLNAMNVYKNGKGDKGKLTWRPHSRILDALNDGFYMAFKVVEPTNKNWMLALDVSGSMTYSNIAGMAITPAIASGALALVTASIEENYHVVGFGDSLQPLDISPKRRLDDILTYMNRLSFGRTDCALPMLYAMDRKLDIDVFVVYTDSETYFGNVHPSQAIRDYRRKMNKPNAKLIVVGMESNGFSIADPKDRGMLDVVGFDTATPELMRKFVMEEF